MRPRDTWPPISGGVDAEQNSVLTTLARGEDLVVIGGDKLGFINVQSATASGWVKIVLVQKQ